jgi:hypothetical protein
MEGRSELIRHTLGHLDEAIRYIIALPWDQRGIRTFLLGSVLPAVATLSIAASADSDFPRIGRTAMEYLLKYAESFESDNTGIWRFYRYLRQRCCERLQPE